MNRICSGCGYTLEECKKCKKRGFLACCPDCKHVLEGVKNGK